MWKSRKELYAYLKMGIEEVEEWKKFCDLLNLKVKQYGKTPSAKKQKHQTTRTDREK
jgi:hypothetical protein